MLSTSERKQLLELMKKAKKTNRPHMIPFLKALLNYEKAPAETEAL